MKGGVEKKVGEDVKVGAAVQYIIIQERLADQSVSTEAGGKSSQGHLAMQR